MATKTFPKVPGIDLCKSKGKNVVFEARINEARRGSKMWLGFDGAYLSLRGLVAYAYDPAKGVGSLRQRPDRFVRFS